MSIALQGGFVVVRNRVPEGVEGGEIGYLNGSVVERRAADEEIGGYPEHLN